VIGSIVVQVIEAIVVQVMQARLLYADHLSHLSA
jgi:hypothetical protein